MYHGYATCDHWIEIDLNTYYNTQDNILVCCNSTSWFASSTDGLVTPKCLNSFV